MAPRRPRRHQRCPQEGPKRAPEASETPRGLQDAQNGQGGGGDSPQASSIAHSTAVRWNRRKEP
eukprot:6682179-Pyramimonas_sp.AAC.1